MIYSAIVFFLLLALVSVSAVEFRDYSSYTFERFESEFGKSYPDNVARNHARANFFVNLHKIIAHNADHSHSYSLGVNKFTDLSSEEVAARYTGYNSAMARSMFKGAKVESFKATGRALPASVDWRTDQGGKVSPVKDQQQCGSCWAFSATETIESALQLQYNDSTVLSPQDVTSCTPNPQHCGGTGGCNGATQELAFEWAEDGIATEATVPYTGSTGTCKTGIKRYAKVDAYVKLDENNAAALMEAVVAGPIAVSAAASSWSLYTSGIFNGCGKDWIINHAVQLVGYGSEKGTNYWIVRNSWGSNWGEKGYIRLLRAADGASEPCGTDTAPGDGSGCTGGPSTVQVCGTCGILSDSSVATKVSKL